MSPSTAAVSLPLPNVLLSPVLLCSLAIAGCVAYLLRDYGRRGKSLPPGPPTLPLLGNLTIFPRAFLHFKFTEWARTYGDVYSVKVLNKTVIVLNTPTMMKEVIDKRSLSNSNRPKSIIADMITPNDMNFGTCRRADQTWKTLRKPAQQILSNERVKENLPIIHAEATQLMWDMAHNPDKWYHLIQRFTSSTVLAIVFGKRGPTLETPDVKDFMQVHPLFMSALELGRLPPVDLFPFLTWVPERWAKWKTFVKYVRGLHTKLHERLLSTVEKRLASGKPNGAFMEEVIKNKEAYGMTREHLLNLGGVLLQGSDTGSASIQNAILAFVRYPERIAKAREEMDRVVGRDRTPTWDDIPNLPYVTAIIEEIHRWRPAGPLGLPHEMTHDETVNGMLFPKDAIIFTNLWGMFRDERYFDRPDEFWPERYILNPMGVKPDVVDDAARRPNMLFGGGRRVCPGIVFMKYAMEILIANFIWAFDFLPELDPVTGKEIMPDPMNFSTNITATPKSFKCRIVPRSPHHLEVIKRQFAATAEHLAPFETELGPEDKAFLAANRDAL